MGQSTRCTNCGHPRWSHPFARDYDPIQKRLVHDGRCITVVGRGSNAVRCECKGYMDDALAKALKEQFEQ